MEKKIKDKINELGNEINNDMHYRIDRNNFYEKPKANDIQTPLPVSYFLYETLIKWFPAKALILDPCSGDGNLLKPWKENDFPTLGIDIKKDSSADIKEVDFFEVENYYAAVSKHTQLFPRLIICNPPFTGQRPKLSPVVWFEKIIKLFPQVPLVLFAPIGFRMNSTLNSERYQNFLNNYPTIDSIITLPKDCFINPATDEPILFHSEILLFNFSKNRFQNLKSHYFFNTPARFLKELEK